jgi:integrase
LALLSTPNPPLGRTDEMPRISKPLTQRMIDTTPAPQTGFKELRERGLVVRIFPSGARSWSLEYRSPVTGKNARLAIEATSLADARAIALRHRVELSERKDPSLERKEALEVRRVEHARSLTVADVLDKYEQPFLAKSPNKQKSRKDRMQKLRRALTPFNARAVGSLARGEMLAFLDRLQAASGPIARNRAHAEIRAWLGWAQLREYVPTNVLDGVQREIKETARARVLSDAELAVMLKETTDGSAFSDIVRVLLHTGMRRNEAASLQPRDLDFEARTIKVRPEVSKTKYERVIPMVDAIAPILKARADGLPREAYIFGEGSNFTVPFAGWDRPVIRLREAMPEGEHWTLHDIRRSVATRLYEADIDALVIEDLLGHIGVRRGVAGVYNRSVTFAKQGKALDDWAVRLASLMGENVIPLRNGAHAQAIGQIR